jgi:hypothetical protein
VALTPTSLLRGVLAAGPRPGTEVEEVMHDAGYSGAQVRRARELLGITVPEGTVVKIGYGRGSYWEWRLPDDDCWFCGRPLEDEEHAEPTTIEASPSNVLDPEARVADTQEQPPSATDTASSWRWGNPDRVPGIGICSGCGKQAYAPIGKPCIYHCGGVYT